MKLSIEAKVAAAIAGGFVALTLGAIAQGNSAGQAGGPEAYGPADNHAVNAQITEQRYNSSPARRTNAQEKRHKFLSDEDMSATNKSGKKANSIKARKHHTQAGRQIERI